MRAHLFNDHHHINIFICVLNLHSWSQPQITLTAKFSQSTVYSTTIIIRNYIALPYKECVDLSSYMQVASVALRVTVWEASSGKNSILRGEVHLLFLHHFPM